MRRIIIYKLVAILLIFAVAGCGQAQTPFNSIVETSSEVPHSKYDFGDETPANEGDVTAELEGMPYATGVERDGYKEYLFTKVVNETEDWTDFTALNATYSIEYTIMLPIDYDFMGPTVLSVAGQKVSELSFVVRLKEGQRMPETLEGFSKKQGSYDYGDWGTNYYDGELLPTAKGRVFLARQIVEPHGGDGSIKIWYPHTFYIETSGYVIAIIFYPLVEYPGLEVIDEYMEIVTSIEIVN